MQQYLKVREAALKYQISEKTIRKWITSKQLPSTTLVINGQSQYALLPKDIETLLAEKSLEPKYPALVEQMPTSGHLDTPSPDKEQITALAAELSYQSEIIEALQLQVETLSARVLALEQARVSPVPVTRSTPQAWPVEARVPSPSPSKSKSDKLPLPDGWYAWDGFLRRHGLRPQSYDQDGYVTRGDYRSGRASVRSALDQDQQTRFVQDYQGKISTCEIETCPCHQVLGQASLWDGEKGSE